MKNVACGCVSWFRYIRDSPVSLGIAQKKDSHRQQSLLQWKLQQSRINGWKRLFSSVFMFILRFRFNYCSKFSYNFFFSLTTTFSKLQQGVRGYESARLRWKRFIISFFTYLLLSAINCALQFLFYAGFDCRSTTCNRLGKRV